MGRIGRAPQPPALGLGWWGVGGFCVLTLALFTHLSYRQQSELASLRQRQQELSQRRDGLLARNQRLRAQLESQQDPAWIEQRLMSRLGVIPKGSRKVVFVDPSG